MVWRDVNFGGHDNDAARLAGNAREDAFRRPSFSVTVSLCSLARSVCGEMSRFGYEAAFFEIEQVGPRRDIGPIRRDPRSKLLEVLQTLTGRFARDRIVIEALDLLRGLLLDERLYVRPRCSRCGCRSSPSPRRTADNFLASIPNSVNSA